MINDKEVIFEKKEECIHYVIHLFRLIPRNLWHTLQRFSFLFRLKLEKIVIAQSLTYQVIASHLCRSVVIWGHSCERKFVFFRFIFYMHTKMNFFFAWMTSYNNRTTKVTHRDLMSEWLLCFPSLLLMTMTLSSTRLFHIKTCWRILNYISFCQSFDCLSKKEMSWNNLKVVFVFHLLEKL